MKEAEVRLVPVKIEEVVEAPKRQVVPEGVKLIHAPEVWKEADSGADNVIAVLDTGCQTDHPDLQGQIVDGRNFTADYDGDPDNYEDNHFHGTHVAGTIAAVNNDVGVVGAAPKAKLLVVKVLNGQGQGSYSSIIKGIRYAADWAGPNGERVRAISMSLGGPRDVPELHEAVEHAVKQNILVVCAAGNEGDGRHSTVERSYPGAYKEVVEVGAADGNRRMAEFSNSNNQIDLVAPGVKVLSTFPGGKYARLSGTSMATPHVSAAAALVYALFKRKFHQTLNERRLFAQLTKQTVSLGVSPLEQGNGLLHLTDFTEASYTIQVKPLGDGYVVELGFSDDEKKALRLAEKTKQDLSKVQGANVKIEVYKWTKQ
ncbi:MAG TPA: S8 family peptidase [Bacillales bacterium]|nr:S8 family peptidase [Bacillales bacterium]